MNPALLLPSGANAPAKTRERQMDEIFDRVQKKTDFAARDTYMTWRYELVLDTLIKEGLAPARVQQANVNLLKRLEGIVRHEQRELQAEFDRAGFKPLSDAAAKKP